MNQIELSPKAEWTLRGVIIFAMGLGFWTTIRLLMGPEPFAWKVLGFVFFVVIVFLATGCWWLLNKTIVQEHR